MPDQMLDCIDCSAPFNFTEGEQKFYEEKNLIAPKRCASCRLAKRKAHDFGQVPGQAFDYTCADCQKPTTLHFQTQRPVYCKECFPKHKTA